MDYWQGVWDEVRPRFVTFRLRVGNIRLSWAFPLWAPEESLVFAAKASPLALSLFRRWRRNPPGPPEPVLPVLRPLLSEDGKHLLRLPSGEPFLSIRTKDSEIDIGQF